MAVLCYIGIVFLSIQLSCLRLFLSYQTRSYHQMFHTIRSTSTSTSTSPLKPNYYHIQQSQHILSATQPIFDPHLTTINNNNSNNTTSIVKFLRKLTYYKICPLSDLEKQTLFEDFAASASSLSFQDISNCFWNLGLIGFKVNILTNQSSVDSVLSSVRSSIVSLEEEEEKGEEEREEDEVDEQRHLSMLPPSHSLLRLVGGLEKVGICWNIFPFELQQRYLGTLNTKMTDEALGREVATLVWTLGRLGASLSDLPQEDQVTLWRRIYLVTLASSLTSQGLSMLTNGLSKLGARWDLIEGNIRSRLTLKIAECDLNAAETCSVVTALASMGVCICICFVPFFLLLFLYILY